LLRQRTVRVDVDPDLAAPLHVAGHGDTCGLDLTVGDVGRRERLEPVVTEGDGRAALRHAGTLRVVLLAVLDPSGDQHLQDSPSVLAGASAARASAAGAGACLAGS